MQTSSSRGGSSVKNAADMQSQQWKKEEQYFLVICARNLSAARVILVPVQQMVDLNHTEAVLARASPALK
jgi:hypothetical protein